MGELARELVVTKVDVIVAPTVASSSAARQATNTIPIVMTAVGDPVASGLVVSLSRPGGNITGLSALATGTAGKRLQMLQELIHSGASVGLILNPGTPYASQALREIKTAADTLHVRVESFEVRTTEQLGSAFDAATRARVVGLLVLEDPLTSSNRVQIALLAAKSNLPAMYGFRGYAEAGGLISYGADLNELFRRAAEFVDKILKGARPADIPVEQPTQFELVINLKTAKALGLAIPQSLLLRADQIIE